MTTDEFENRFVNKVICGDCLEVMKDWPDGCVDLMLTDPPYGINVNKMVLGLGGGIWRKIDRRGGTWDQKSMSPEQRDECLRIGQNQVIFGGNYFDLPPSRCWFIWDKRVNLSSDDYADCEMAWTSFDKVTRIIRYLWRGMLQGNMANREIKYHPTQKPLPVMQWILERYSKPDELILDPFCGSGTTCVAAKRLGRRYIGIDISEEYCEITRQRLITVDTGVPVKEQKAGQEALFV